MEDKAEGVRKWQKEGGYEPGNTDYSRGHGPGQTAQTAEAREGQQGMADSVDGDLPLSGLGKAPGTVGGTHGAGPRQRRV